MAGSPGIWGNARTGGQPQAVKSSRVSGLSGKGLHLQSSGEGSMSFSQARDEPQQRELEFTPPESIPLEKTTAGESGRYTLRSLGLGEW